MTGAGGLHVAGSPSARGAHQDVQIDRSGSCQNTCRRSFHGLTAAIAEPPAAVRLPAIENGADHSPVAVVQKLEVGLRLLLSIQNRSSWSLLRDTTATARSANPPWMILCGGWNPAKSSTDNSHSAPAPSTTITKMRPDRGAAEIATIG